MMLSQIEALDIKCEKEDKKGRHLPTFYHVSSVFCLLNPQSSRASLIASRMKCFIIKPNIHVVINHIAIKNRSVAVPVVPSICSRLIC